MVMKHNYFQFDQQYYKQTDGLAVGCPNITNIGRNIYTADGTQTHIFSPKHTTNNCIFQINR
jgi:hypothetical protein